MTSRGHNLVFCTDKRPQKIIIRYSTQTNDLTKVITHYPMQKYDLKMSQSRIPHGQTTSKDHNLVFHIRLMTSQMHSTSKDKGHNLVSHHRLMTSLVYKTSDLNKGKGHT